MEITELIDRIKSGQQEAWNMLISRYSKSVYNIALNFSGSSDEAADITQDIFLKVYTQLDKYHDEYNFTSWLMRLARNTCIDYWRKNKRNRMQSELEENMAVDYESPEEDAVKGNEAVFLRKLINLINPDLRLLLVMRDVDDKSYQEISDALDLPIGTVKSRINRARVKLAQLYRQQGGHHAVQ
jgi:RNA polymerase sigma-70 factor (ECF subfamily)